MDVDPTRGLSYLERGAAEGLWRLLRGDEVPELGAAREVIVVGGVQWSRYDVAAFTAFAGHLRAHPRCVYAFDLDDAVDASWHEWAPSRFPGVTLPNGNRFNQPPIVAQYVDGALLFEAHADHACDALARGLG